MNSDSDIPVLCKQSSYHRRDRGYDPTLDREVWDRIYVTTLFTFDFAVSVETINHYALIILAASERVFLVAVSVWESVRATVSLRSSSKVPRPKARSTFF